jgi:hypothetical protein
VTFEPRPQKERPDLQFWGGTQVWVVSVTGKPEPHPVTVKSVDETYGLRWLDDHTLIFDRVADVCFLQAVAHLESKCSALIEGAENSWT